FLNERRVSANVKLESGDKIRIGPSTVFKFALYDELDEHYERQLRTADSGEVRLVQAPWSRESWQSKPEAQAITYPDASAVDRAFAKLSKLPPLVTSWEIEELKRLLADAQEGR